MINCISLNPKIEKPPADTHHREIGLRRRRRTKKERTGRRLVSSSALTYFFVHHEPTIQHPSPTKTHHRFTEVALCRLRIGQRSSLLADTNKPQGHRCGGSHLSFICLLNVRCATLKENVTSVKFRHITLVCTPIIFIRRSRVLLQKKVLNYLADVDFLKYLLYGP